MTSIEITLRDEQGNIVGQVFNKTYELNLGQQTLHEIEGAVEAWKHQVLPDIECELLSAAQARFTQEKKKRRDSL